MAAKKRSEDLAKIALAVVLLAGAMLLGARYSQQPGKVAGYSTVRGK